MKLFRNPYACAHCQESFDDPKALVSHVKHNHKIDKLVQKDNTVVLIKYTYETKSFIHLCFLYVPLLL